MKKRHTIPIEVLRQILEYRPETDELFWKHRPVGMFAHGRHSQQHTANLWNKRFAGRRAFTQMEKGYYVGRIGKKPFKAHRVIWALHYGRWPEDQLDHIDHNRANNKISNLAEVTNAENCKNKVLLNANSSGAHGIHWFKRDQNWQAYINSNGKRFHLGYFQNKDEAIAARKTAEARFGFHPNHGA